MAVRNDFTAGEVLAAADLNDTFASKLPYSYGTATPSTTDSGFLWYDSNSTPAAPKFWDGAAFQALTSGKILQIVNAAYSTELSTTSGTAVDTGLTATITPTAASSKILVHMNLQCNGQNSDLIWGRLLRGATTIVGNSRICNSAGVTSWNVNYLDTPNTTSSTTYKAQVYKDIAGGTAFLCQWNAQQTSTMTLIEVAA